MEQNQKKHSAHTAGPLIEFNLPDLKPGPHCIHKTGMTVLIMPYDIRALGHAGTVSFSIC